MILKDEYINKLETIIFKIEKYSQILKKKLNEDIISKNTSKLTIFFKSINFKIKNLNNINFIIIDDFIIIANKLCTKYLIDINNFNINVILKKYLIFIVKLKLLIHFLQKSLSLKINDGIFSQKENNYLNIKIKEYSKFNINKKYKNIKKLIMINIITTYYIFNKPLDNYKKLFEIELNRPNNFLELYNYDSLKNIKKIKINLFIFFFKMMNNIFKQKNYKEIKEEFDLVNCFACPSTYFNFVEIPNYWLIKRSLKITNISLNKQIKKYINIDQLKNKYFKLNENKNINKNILFLKNSYIIDESDYNKFTSKKKIENYRKMRIIKNKLNKNKLVTIIFHIHGGGFICLSSSQYQNFFNYILNKIKNCIIFSLDYILSPSIKYPFNFNDILIGYIWTLNYLKIKNINNYSINLAGDSAGGNLVGMLNIWIIENNLRIPNSLVMSYPVVNFNTSLYTKSNKYLFKDVLLNYGFLSICYNSYIPTDINFETDYYINLLILPSSVLKKFPKILFNICDKDILKDNTIRFFYLLKNNYVKAKAILYKDTFHGIINFSFYYKFKFLREVNDDIINFLIEN